MSKNIFFYIGWGCSRDHLGPHKTQKWPEKRVEKEPKTGQDRPRYHKLPIHRPSGQMLRLDFKKLFWGELSVGCRGAAPPSRALEENMISIGLGSF